MSCWSPTACALTRRSCGSAREGEAQRPDAAVRAAKLPIVACCGRGQCRRRAALLEAGDDRTFGFHEARRRGPSGHRRGSDRDGGGHALHGLTRLDYRAPDNGRGPRRILLQCAGTTGRARGIGTAATFNGTPPTGSTGYAARAPRLVRNRSFPAVPAGQRRGRSTSISGPPPRVTRRPDDNALDLLS